MYEVHETKEGPCPLCLGARQKQLFVVRSAGGYCGDVCPEHLAVLLKQQAKEPQRELNGNP